MNRLSTYMLSAHPHESLRALEKTVAQQFHWRMLTDGGNEPSRFMIEKQVRYTLLRGWTMDAIYRITGSVQPGDGGKTILQYAVSGQSGVPLFQAALVLIIMIVITLMLGGIVFSPGMMNRGIGLVLIGVLSASMIGYSWFAYRNYQTHLRELHHFIQEFVQRMEQFQVQGRR